MELLVVSFIAGVLTVLAPCILPMLPIVVGGSLTGGARSFLRPLVVTLSLAGSIVFFTLLLKATTAFLVIPDAFWRWFSTGIILAFAITLLFPHAWARIASLFSFGRVTLRANQQLARQAGTESYLSAFFIGIALGPVFAACSPTYFLILGTVLPNSFIVGIVNLAAYALGLAMVLLLVAFAGQKVMTTLNLAADPNGWFKKGLGVLFLLVALAILSGYDKKFETYLIERGYGVTELEQNLLQDLQEEPSDMELPIPQSEVQSGGPPKDGIPPIDAPQFITRSAATFLNPADEGIGIVGTGGTARFYPFRVLVWHEIVNEVLDGQQLVVTYCPLCRTGIVFESLVDGVHTTFGTSGKLWQSNLLMYDRQSSEADESLWSQVLGTAVIGPQTGTKLTIYPATITTFERWAAQYPETQILSTETGNPRDYTRDPYDGYYDSEEVYFPTDFSDAEMHPKELVLGLAVEGNYIAYKKEALKSSEDTFAGHFITIERNGDTVQFYVDDQEHPHIEGFWFSWQAVHPSTVLR